MTRMRTLATLGATLALGACVTAPPPGPAAMVAPGSDKTAVAFQQDQAVCQQHAIAHQGYGTPTADGPAAPLSPRPVGAAANPGDPPTGAAAAAALPTTDTGFMQCMAARGDSVQMIALGDPYAYGSPYPFAYPYQPLNAYPGDGYGYGYGYPGYGLGLGGVAFLGAGGFDNGSFRHNGDHGGGFHNGSRGAGAQNGFHGGGFQSGFRGAGAQNGFHGGGAPGGGFHGGGSHGGGHR